MAIRIARAGLAASLMSGAAMTWCGRRELASAAAPHNGPSQYVHGREAVRHDAPSWSHTAVGVAVHTAMSLFWAAGFEALQARRRGRGRILAAAVQDASLVTAAAAIVDLRLVPDRWSPGFQHRLSRPSTALVYLGFAAGLVLASRARR